MNDEDRYIIEQTIESGDLNVFSNHFFKKPTTGTRWVPGDRENVGHYRDLCTWEVLKSGWDEVGRPPEFLVQDTYTISAIGDEPHFVLNHGYLHLDWLSDIVAQSTDIALVETGTGTGKTTGVCIAALTYCVLHPGFKFLNAGPTQDQADLMMGEVERWVPGSPLEQFVIKPKRSDNLFHGGNTLKIKVGNWVSEFECRTIGRDANSLTGGTWDWVNMDEVQYIYGVLEVAMKMVTRFRGIRSDGKPRWAKITMLTNPGDSPELGYLKEGLQKKADEQDVVKIVVKDEVDGVEVNPYYTEKQRAMQDVFMPEHAKNRWLGGKSSDLETMRIFSPVLLNLCRDEEMEAALDGMQVKEREGMGIIRYRFPYNIDNSYVVAADVGSANATYITYNNVPVVCVFDIGTTETFLNEPIRLASMSMIDGEGTYKPFLSEFKAAMTYYGNAMGYYDATNVHTGLEDGESLTGYGTLPISFGAKEKGWAKTIMITLMQDGRFAMPYLRALWYQFATYREDGPGVKKLPDDIIACFFVFALSLRYENVLWSKMVERYKFHGQEWEEDEGKKKEKGENRKVGRWGKRRSRRRRRGRRR